MRRQKQVCLSAFLPSRAEEAQKLLAVRSKGITVIDELNSYLASEVESLDLHGNRLASLAGIEQFSCLRELDISDNRLQRCQELGRLRQLPQLRKLYLSGNPFLNQPLPEAMLQLILDKETDIEILSFEVLSTLKDVQQREIRIIFLKNYIQKLGLHNELRKKQQTSPPHSQLQAEDVLSKLVPQFYTLIEDPQLISKIKREAIDKKKQSRESIGEALAGAKEQKEQKIDELVKSIVELLHPSEQFKRQHSFLLEVNLNDNTISFSPERRKDLKDHQDHLSLASGEFSPVKYIEMSKDEASLEDISFTHAKQPTTATRNNQKPAQSRRQDTLHMSLTKPLSFPKGDLDNLETARKSPNAHSTQSISLKMRQHSEMKQNVQSQLRRMKEKESLASSKVENIEKQPNKKSFDMSKLKKNLPTHSNNFIKVIEENQDESQDNKESQEQRQKPPVTPKNTQNLSLLNQSSIEIGQQMTPEAIETIYFRSLAKTNPMFSLLHSPATSLNAQQKNELLQALKVDHKDKFIELIKQRLSNQRLMRQIEQLRNDHAKEVESITNNNRNFYNQYLLYKQQFEWIDERQRSTQAKNEELATLLRQKEASEKKKSTALNILQANFKKLKDACAEKHQRLVLIDNAEDREETIREKHEALILKKYLHQLSSRAQLWKKVVKHSQKVIKTREKLLIQWGMESFIFNRMHQRTARQQLQTHNLNILREHFKQWKACNQLEKKEKKVIEWAWQKRSSEILPLLKRNDAASKMRKLKNIWAQRFLLGLLYKKSIKAWQTLKSEADGKAVRALQHRKTIIQTKIFQGLQRIVKERKKYVEEIFEKRTNRLINEQFKRMLYIIRKETAEIQEKQRKTEAYLEEMRRKTYFQQFATHIQAQIQLKSKRKLLNRRLVGKNMNVFKKLQRSARQKLSKLRSFCHYLSFGVSLRMMRREKVSNEFGLLLNRRQKMGFLKNLRRNWHTQSEFRRSKERLGIVAVGKTQLMKLRVLKRMETLRLRGRNYVKQRAIQQLSHQIQLNDHNTIGLIRNEKEEISRCEKEIHLLRTQIQGQAVREAALLRQRDEMMLSINESYEIMMALRQEVDGIRAECGQQQEKYNALVQLYNQSVEALQRKERDYEWLYDSLRLQNR